MASVAVAPNVRFCRGAAAPADRRLFGWPFHFWRVVSVLSPHVVRRLAGGGISQSRPAFGFVFEVAGLLGYRSWWGASVAVAPNVRFCRGAAAPADRRLFGWPFHFWRVVRVLSPHVVRRLAGGGISQSRPAVRLCCVMPTFRPDLARLVTYTPGKRIDEVAREFDLDPANFVKLASNESPEGPFPGVAEAVNAALAESNRYPDTEAFDLAGKLADWLRVDRSEVWLGAGSTGLLTHIAYGVGGPGTSAVFAWPSFIMYRIISKWAMAEAIEVPLTADRAHDLEAMGSAIRDDTTAVYVCNPNNPTGTIVGGDDLAAFVESVPDSVLIVVDEAYHEFASNPSYRTALPLSRSHANVIVLRTFSKIYGLAAHRIGYAIGKPDTLAELQRTQAPFTVSSVAQAAAMASLDQPAEVARRVEANAAGRHHLIGALTERGLTHTKTETNFVYFCLEGLSGSAGDEFMKRGVIVRPMSKGWIRVTVGNPSENERFVIALDDVLSGVGA